MATMTHASNPILGASAREFGVALAGRFAAWNERRRAIAQITRELNSYSAREIAELGLSHGDIADVARGRFAR